MIWAGVHFDWWPALAATLAVPRWLLGLFLLSTLILSVLLYRARTVTLQNAPSHLTAVDEGDILAEDRIQIIVPRPGEVLTDPVPFGKDFSYMVRGRLKSVPHGHVIWLLTQDERSGKVWPQNFYPVQFNEGEWHGRIHAGAVTPLRIFAVVAPPTSQMLFRYFQERGQETNTYAALLGVPPECHNRHSVQTKLP